MEPSSGKGEELVSKREHAEPMEETKEKPVGDRKQEKFKQKQQKRRAIMENSNLLVDKKDLSAALQRQIEFYFSDSNLYHDAFLYSLLQQSPKRQEVDTSVILAFTRVRDLLSETKEQTEKVERVKSALAKSSLVEMSEDMMKIRRKQLFNKDEYRKSQVDRRTIYVENLPSAIVHESLAAIFAKIGRLLHVSLPKFAQSRKPKGFAFIEFEASLLFRVNIGVECGEGQRGGAESQWGNSGRVHGCRKQALRPARRYYNKKDDTWIQIGQVQALRVMSVEEWLTYKKEFKSLMKEIEDLNGLAATKEQSKTSEGDFRGCLVRLEEVPENTTKANVKIFVSNFVKPEYVDYKRGNPYAIVRFRTPELAENFIKAYQGKEKTVSLGKGEIRIRGLDKKEEEEYQLLVDKQKREFKDYCSSKKKKKHDEE
ncbi:MAG: la-related family protein [Candidatus Pacebacteria bacterium]|nr:la-related family protein [Candidatus Paceibacterota bacterium]